MTVSAGSISLMKIRSVRNLLFPQSLQTAVATEVSADVWKSVSMLREFPVTVLLRSVETTQSTRWLTFFRMFVLLTRTMTLTRQRSKVLLKCLTRNSTLTTKRLVSLDVEQLQHLRSSTHHQAVVQ